MWLSWQIILIGKTFYEVWNEDDDSVNSEEDEISNIYIRVEKQGSRYFVYNDEDDMFMFNVESHEEMVEYLTNNYFNHNVLMREENMEIFDNESI